MLLIEVKLVDGILGRATNLIPSSSRRTQNRWWLSGNLGEIAYRNQILVQGNLLHRTIFMSNIKVIV